ncbi:helix-turn-helix domain-containing protein [Phascolarctobacterium sp.]|uniref:helix-turn-helix domain-containing protein n=1 Tax=Phascolarctobacterium sp. TaxID=2049039 RepID=UPI00386FF8F6
MSDLEKYIEEQMQDSEFKKIHDESRLEYELMHTLIGARIEKNMTQKELAEVSGVRQSNISRIENGMCIPTVTTLQALAKGLGKKLVISFE